ncbi:MAG: class I SAM-dependent methyltransferase [Pseudomonadota bacterium]|nr:class I SAM-dependent methyltransferase [Pseudomonadota bacterium]
MKNTIKHYSEKAQHYYDLYHSVDAESVHSDWKAFLQNTKAGTALDVGAGSGRDANWLAEQGWKVVAVEPADNLRTLAQSNAHNSVTWCNARLPELNALPHEPITYDLILLSAVWMHLSPDERTESMQYISSLLNTGGRLVITLRHGAFNDVRLTFPINVDEVYKLAQKYDLSVILVTDLAYDQLGRTEVSWQTLVLEKKR